MADSALRRPPAPVESSWAAPRWAAPRWLKTLPPARRWVLHGDADARTRAAAAWGVGFSEVACRAMVAQRRATLWLGPDEHLLLDLEPVGAEDDGAALEAALELAMQGVPHALVDISHRQFALEVSGPHAETILSGACPLDLDAGAFPVGMCTRTVFAKAEIVLWRTRADAFHVEIWRSFADYVAGILAEIGREFEGSEAR